MRERKERNIENLKIVRKEEADNYYIRNIKNYKNKCEDQRLSNILKLNSIKGNTILEIGCCNGKRLDQYRRCLGSHTTIGVDLSKKAIREGKKLHKKITFKNISSLEINKLKIKFDIIICGFFLYLLDREEIFNQFDLIYKNLKNNGYLIIEDFDPLFKHTNKSIHNKKLKSFKMNYSNFLEESGLFKIIYKIRNDENYISNKNKKKFKSNDTSISLYKKINFIEVYPNNL
jgi:cyclopropane fatty-acyl-phospholipid synthase-like methyltransferase